jgi:hypothetical protein
VGTNSCPACREVRRHTISEWSKHHPQLIADPEPDPVQPKANGSLAERCAWLRARMIEREMYVGKPRRRRVP